MANNKKLKFFIKNYWNYYLRLEEEFLTALKYVEFDRDNYQTFSIEFLTVLLSVCSEIDVVGKVIANDFNKNFIPEKKDNTIYKWWYEIQNFLLLSDKVVNFRDIETIKPWYNFQIEQATNKKGNISDQKNHQTRKFQSGGIITIRLSITVLRQMLQKKKQISKMLILKI